MVLVSGGNHNDKSLMPFAELYNPVRGVWKIAGVLAAPRYGHTATMLKNEKVLVVGGTSGLSPLASIELFKSPVCSGVTSDR
jgi:N-acetylneuraminic acid mutarotase